MNKNIFLLLLGLVFLGGCSSSPEKKSNETKTQPEATKISAIDSLSRLVTKHPGESKYLQARGDKYIEMGDIESAKPDIVKAIRLDSLNSDLFVSLSKVYFAENKFAKGVLALQKAIELDNHNATAILNLAEVNLLAHKSQEAVKLIDRVIKMDDLNPRSYYLRGLIWLQMGDTIRGIQNFQQALKVDNDYFEANAQLGLLFADKKNDLAIDYYENAIRSNPGNPTVYYSLGYFYQQTRRYEKAMQTYDRLIKKFPRFDKAYYNKGYINLVFYKKYLEAINDFTQAIKINPNYANAYYNRAYCKILLHQKENAEKDLKRCLEINPDHKLAKKKLKELHAK